MRGTSNWFKVIPPASLTIAMRRWPENSATVRLAGGPYKKNEGKFGVMAIGELAKRYP